MYGSKRAYDYLPLRPSAILQDALTAVNSRPRGKVYPTAVHIQILFAIFRRLSEF